ncbi:MAG: hypothetical protein MZU84_08870 [Sphingobacterium sp.]|nr:hypothetical protein [Sphingobacterium sp.]
MVAPVIADGPIAVGRVGPPVEIFLEHEPVVFDDHDPLDEVPGVRPQPVHELRQRDRIHADGRQGSRLPAVGGSHRLTVDPRFVLRRVRAPRREKR